MVALLLAYFPGEHSKHVEGPGSVEYEPGEHSVHVVDPSEAAWYPGLHNVQVELLLLAEKVPLGQRKHI